MRGQIGSKNLLEKEGCHEEKKPAYPDRQPDSLWLIDFRRSAGDLYSESGVSGACQCRWRRGVPDCNQYCYLYLLYHPYDNQHTNRHSTVGSFSSHQHGALSSSPSSTTLITEYPRCCADHLYSIRGVAILAIPIIHYYCGDRALADIWSHPSPSLKHRPVTRLKHKIRELPQVHEHPGSGSSRCLLFGKVR